MREPSPRTSRLAIAGGLAAAALFGGIGFFVGRSTAPVPAPPVTAPPPKLAKPPVDSLTIDRTMLLALVNAASDAASSGMPVPAEVSKAAGRRFDLILPFGCEGPGDRDRLAGLGWHYDAASETLRVRVFPTRWQPGDWGLTMAAPPVSGLEGFWIERPWSSASACPATAARAEPTDSDPILLPGQTLAIARLVNEGADEPARPLETVQRMAADAFDPTQGFRLRILGRLTPTPSGAPVKCVQSGGSAQRPLCIIWMKPNEIRIENPANGAVLATWPYGGEIAADS